MIPGSMQKKRGFTLLELIAALSILVIVTGAFYATLRGIYRLQFIYEAETDSIVVLNNTLERIDHGHSRSEKNIRTIFEDEFRRSPLAGRGDTEAVCKAGKRRTVKVQIIRGQRLLGEMEIAQ